MLKAVWKTITPDEAKEILEKSNLRNYRRLSAYFVKRYATDMKNGLWQDNAEPIQFYEDGTLFNGQHRLSAVVEAGVPITFLVVYGVKKDVSIADVGGVRSAGQISGISDSLIGSTVLYMKLSGMIHKHGSYPKATVIRYTEENLDDLKAASDIAVRGGKSPISKKASVLCAVYALKKSKEDLSGLEGFFMTVNTGLPVEIGKDYTPALVLRRMIIDPGNMYNAQCRIDLADATYQAIRDFQNEKSRKKNYVPGNSLERFINQTITGGQ